MEYHKLDVLKEALPYIQKFKKKIFVIKLSGKVVSNQEILASLAEQVALLHQVGFYPVIVHGGGNQVNELAKRLGIEQTIVQGRRVTNRETLDLAKMVFGGLVNTNLTSALRKVSLPIVGLSGLDGHTIRARRREPKKMFDEKNQEVEVDFGYVGDVVGVDTTLVQLLLKEGYIPVISSLGADEEGEVYNINADTIAVEMAISLKAEKILFLTDVNGILLDAKEPQSKIDVLTMAKGRELIETGVIHSGMVPKMVAILKLLEQGVSSAHVVGALEENALLKEIFTDRGVGTMVIKE